MGYFVFLKILFLKKATNLIVENRHRDVLLKIIFIYCIKQNSPCQVLNLQYNSNMYKLEMGAICYATLIIEKPRFQIYKPC